MLTCRNAVSLPSVFPLPLWSMALLVLVTGCGGPAGPEKATVMGKVTFDGAAVEKGSLAFIPTGQTKGPTAGAVIEKGEYRTLSGGGPVLGSHRVEITAYRTGQRLEIPGAGGATTGPSGASVVAETDMYIPEQYNKASTLTIDIKSGRNQGDFNLKSKP